MAIDLLRAELLRIAGWQQTGESLYLGERHLVARKDAARDLDHASAHAAQTGPVAGPVRRRAAPGADAALHTGPFSSDDLLGVIFSRFCIGK